MPTFNVSFLNKEFRESQTYSDQETGCVSYQDKSAFEECRQSYFLKQQNIILSNNTSENNESYQKLISENNQLYSEIINLRNENINLQSRNSSQMQYFIFSTTIIVFIFIIWTLNKKIKNLKSSTKVLTKNNILNIKNKLSNMNKEQITKEKKRFLFVSWGFLIAMVMSGYFLKNIEDAPLASLILSIINGLSIIGLISFIGDAKYELTNKKSDRFIGLLAIVPFVVFYLIYSIDKIYSQKLKQLEKTDHNASR